MPLIAVDGPKGVGKTTVLELCTANPGVSVIKSPSAQFARYLEEDVRGPFLLAELIRDRRRQVDEVIMPKVATGELVLMDHYLVPTLVFQSLDGCRVEEILAAHEGLPLPDIQLLMTARERTLSVRRNARGTTSRLQGLPIEAELRAYDAAATTMRALGVPTYEIQTDDVPVAVFVRQITIHLPE